MQQQNNMMQRAREAVNALANNKANANQQEKQAAQNAIQAAKNQASSEEQQQLQQLEQQLQQKPIAITSTTFAELDKSKKCTVGYGFCAHH